MTPSAYLARIGYAGNPLPDLDTLRELHLSHLRAIPFENLAIHAGEKIVLDEAALYAKIVGRRRGGICYELNGLFAWLLRALGFEVTLLAANVHVGETELTPDFDHMVLMVTIDGRRYLADVGFGDSFLLPLALTENGGAADGDGMPAYAIETADGHHTLLRTDTGTPARSVFRFTTTPHSLAEFEPRCDFHQHSPDTHFRRKIVCSRATPHGRITLRGAELIVEGEGERRVTTLDTPEQVALALRAHFGMEGARWQPPGQRIE